MDFIINKTKEKISNLTIVSVVVIILIFVYEIIKGKITEKIGDILFPEKTKAITETTKKILDKTNSILEKISIDPRIIKNYLNDLSSFSTTERKKSQIIKWYEEFKVNATLKDILILIIDHRDATIKDLEEKIETEQNSEYTQAIINLKKYLEEDNAKQIKENYFQYIKQQ